MLGRVNILWQLMRGQRLRYGLAIVAMLITTCCMMIRPQIGRYTIDYVIQGKPLRAPQFVHQTVAWLGGRSILAQNLWTVFIALAAVAVVGGVFIYLRGRWSAQASESIARSLRERLYDHLQHLPCTYHDRTPTGDLVQRCTSDVETIRMFLAMEIVDLARAVLMLGVMLPVLFALNVRIALWSVAVFPLIILFAAVFFAKIRATFKHMDEAEGRMTALLQENLTGIRVVRAFARQEFEKEKFARGNADYRDRWYRLIWVMALYWPMSELLVRAQKGLVLVVGAYYVIMTHGAADEFTVGMLYVFFACTNMLLWPVQQMGRILADLGKAVVALGRIQEILTHQPEPDADGAARRVPAINPHGRIAIDGLSFSHGQDSHVLTDVSFEVEAGQTVAILGPAGSGKSTLINLLLRLYDYDAGSIRLDGMELRDLPRKYVRAQIGVVLQDPFLYSRTLRENIKLGHTAAHDDEMIEAATAACIHESITTFDGGYDTVVGERGVTLSGGQRQRVALARALLKRPPVLILDDALSAVDTGTESLILQALRQRHGRRTTLVIAHRLTTLRSADLILVLEGGRIVQSGTHRTLRAADGMYRRLWEIQGLLEEDLDAGLTGPAGGQSQKPSDRP